MHQYLEFACANMRGFVLVLDVLAFPLAFGLPFLAGFLASRGHEDALLRHGALAGLIVSVIGAAATSARQVAKTTSHVGAPHGAIIVVGTFLLMVVNLGAFGLLGAYVGVRWRRRKRR